MTLVASTTTTDGPDLGLTDDTRLRPEARRCLERFFRWGAAPTVDGYCDLFAPTGTLLDADMDAPISGTAIRDSMTRVLTLLPDFRFAPRAVVAEGPHLFVLAANGATLGDRVLAWDAIYALTLAGDRIGAGRRYYDQAALALGTETFALDASVAAVKGYQAETSSRPTPDAGIDLGARAAAWNARDADALVAPLADARLVLAGVARPLAGAEIPAALARVLARSVGLTLAPGAGATSSAGRAFEWVGTIGLGAARRRFALVELVTRAGSAREWRLLFNTLGM